MSRDDVWFRCVGGNWIAYRGDEAIWEEPTRLKLVLWLKENGHPVVHWPLRVAIFREDSAARLAREAEATAAAYAKLADESVG